MVKPNRLTEILAWTPIPTVGERAMHKVVTSEFSNSYGSVDAWLSEKINHEVARRRARVYHATLLICAGVGAILYVYS